MRRRIAHSLEAGPRAPGRPAETTGGREPTLTHVPFSAGTPRRRFPPGPPRRPRAESRAAGPEGAAPHRGGARAGCPPRSPRPAPCSCGTASAGSLATWERDRGPAMSQGAGRLPLPGVPGKGQRAPRAGRPLGVADPLGERAPSVSPPTPWAPNIPQQTPDGAASTGG